ncbi:hypothetical protein HSBAA_42880 [Vreelandella sulfidaeris]|uniref:Transport-associated OB type 2 domain-containing protein n=1 Tax=Vreelandella sulfidaeris TaxID=115553 RepID=A0A455U9Y2_9GAMM|nr:hypothetical protein HSBAA_42880 [Halomonas sulfidaeris]
MLPTIAASSPRHLSGPFILTTVLLPRQWIVGFGRVAPRKIWLTREKPTTEYNWAEGRVDDIAYLGGFSLYYVRTAAGQMIKVSMANTERRGDRPTWEDSVYVHWEDHSTIVLNR